MDYEKIFPSCLSTMFTLFLIAQTNYDASVINKIKDEERNNSEVMGIAFHLTNVRGPRLTASPGFLRAAEWAKNILQSWGLSNVKLEPWGDFGIMTEIDGSCSLSGTLKFAGCLCCG